MELECEGKRLRLRVLDPADMLDLIEAAGENAGNRNWLRLAMLVCSVAAIDGVPVPFPRDVGGIKSVARQLGTLRLEAVRQAMAADASVVETAAKN